MAIENQATLRSAIADWLNRSDLSDDQIDTFIEIGEARIYEELRVPPLETMVGYSITSDISEITLPEGFSELIELRKTGSGTCNLDPTNNITRALCSSAYVCSDTQYTDEATCVANLEDWEEGTWTDSDKDDDFTLRRIDNHTFHNNKVANAFTRELDNLKITNSSGERKAEGEYVLKYYKAESPIGEVVDGEEQIPWILYTEYEIILFAALAVAQTFLGDVESEAHYNELTARKILALNEKTKKADLKGGIFTSNFSTALI